VPLFYANVELNGYRGAGAVARPAARLLDLSGESATKYNTASERSNLRAAVLSTKQHNVLRRNISRIALSESSPKGSVVAIKGKKRRPNSADIQVGEAIRAHRLIIGMSQADLASQLGVSFQQVQKYEKGMNRVGAGRLPQIARIFGIPISALFDANADTSPGKSAGAAPVKLIADRHTLKLLTSFGGIAHRKVRHSLVGLIDAIAKSTPKSAKVADRAKRISG
jgi:transcriptional regulator with XRE-family HTH domain